jgi:hypothetical protein
MVTRGERGLEQLDVTRQFRGGLQGASNRPGGQQIGICILTYRCKAR